MKKIILLCDYGLYDAVATVYLLEKFPNTYFDIVCVGGNVSERQSFKNAFTLLSNYEGNLSKVRIIDTSAIPQPGENLSDIHGLDGIGGFLKKENDISFIPVLTYEYWINEVKPDDYIVSLGPLTVTKEILSRKGMHKLLIMAGCVDEEPNYNGYEFNHAMDKDAFAFCIKYPHVIATLDSCRAPIFNLAGKRTEGRRLLERLINRSIELAEKRHSDRCYIYDYIAARYLAAPGMFTVREVQDKDGNVLSSMEVIN